MPSLLRRPDGRGMQQLPHSHFTRPASGYLTLIPAATGSMSFASDDRLEGPRARAATGLTHGGFHFSSGVPAVGSGMKKSLFRCAALSVLALSICASALAAEPATEPSKPAVVAAKKDGNCGTGCCGAAKGKSGKKAHKMKKEQADPKPS